MKNIYKCIGLMLFSLVTFSTKAALVEIAYEGSGTWRDDINEVTVPYRVHLMFDDQIFSVSRGGITTYLGKSSTIKLNDREIFLSNPNDTTLEIGDNVGGQDYIEISTKLNEKFNGGYSLFMRLKSNSEAIFGGRINGISNVSMTDFNEDNEFFIQEIDYIMSTPYRGPGPLYGSTVPIFFPSPIFSGEVQSQTFISSIPIPASVFLLLSGLIGLVGIRHVSDF